MDKDIVLEALKEQKSLIEGKFEGVGEQLTVMDTRVKDLEASQAKGKISVPGLEDEKEKFSLFKAVKAIRSGDWAEAAFEKEVFDTTKAMSVGSDSGGGYVVPTQALSDLIEMFKAKSTVIQAGATVMDGLVGSPLEIPKQTGGATGYWTGENAAITASDLSLGQVTMSPKQASALVKMSNRLLRLSNPAAEGIIRRDLSSAIALLVDLAALRGVGASDQPLGIANTSGINTIAIGATGGDFIYDHINEMEYELDIDNALQGSLGFITHPKVIQKLKQKRITQFTGDLTGAPITLSDSDLANQTGYNWLRSTQLPIDLVKSTSSDCTEVYFGNWEELIIGSWSGLEIMASSETSDAFEKNQMWLRVIQEVDVAVRHPESFCLCSDARTN